MLLLLFLQLLLLLLLLLLLQLLLLRLLLLWLLLLWRRWAGQTWGAGPVLQKRIMRVLAVFACVLLPPPHKMTRFLGCAYLLHTRHERPGCALTRSWWVSRCCYAA